MGFRLNIALSVAIHAALIIAVSGIVSGRDAASRVPERTISVDLLGDLIKSVISPSNGRRDTAGETMKNVVAKKEKGITQPGVKEISGQNNNPYRQTKEKLEPEAGQQGRTGSGAGAGLVFEVQGSGSGDTSAGTHQGSTTSGTQIEGEGTGGGVRAGKQDVLGMIKAAIEKAKNYPPLARKRGIEGTATAEFTINNRGVPENIRILKSSGSDILDTAAKNTVLRASPFPPVNGGIEVPITFRIDK